jgi:hypothetical protein
MQRREHIEWCDIWVAGAEADRRPRLLLVGDSITRSYYDDVAKAIEGRLDGARLTTSKFVGDPGFAMELRLLLDQYEFAVIHFNNGLHGWDYSEAEYDAGLRAAFDLLAARAPRARLIWAHSTPVRKPGGGAALDPSTGRVRERNRLAAALCRERAVPVNDLFAPLIDHPEYFSADGVHLVEAGRALLGAQVAAAVLDDLR